MQHQLGEANTALREKEVECIKLAEERDRLVAQLAEQAEALKAAQLEVMTKEVNLLAEFEVERSTWADKEAQMTACFSSIEDLVDGQLHSLGFLFRTFGPHLGRYLAYNFGFFFLLPKQTSSQAILSPRST